MFSARLQPPDRAEGMEHCVPQPSVRRHAALHRGFSVPRAMLRGAALAAENNKPVALIIGSDPYRRSVEKHLVKVWLVTPKTDDEPRERERALRISNDGPHSNFGWRIILAHGDQALARLYVLEAAKENLHLDEVIPEAERDAVLKEATIRVAIHGVEEEEDEADEAVQRVAVTSYEGSKGRSAQYVFLIGAHSGELSRNAAAIRDIEICKFLVGLTRSKNKCNILAAKKCI